LSLPLLAYSHLALIRSQYILSTLSSNKKKSQILVLAGTNSEIRTYYRICNIDIYKMWNTTICLFNFQLELELKRWVLFREALVVELHGELLGDERGDPPISNTKCLRGETGK
jgi:hypothetical protein